MATLSIGIAAATTVRKIPKFSTRRSKISCEWDPKGLLGPAQTGHIARLEFKRRLERDSEAREAFQKQLREEKERREALRQARVVPDTSAELIEYFLDTEAQEIEFEIARLRGRLNEEFFAQIRLGIGQIRFAVTKTAEAEDRLIELESLQKALEEGIEAYDKMQNELMTASNSLTKILTSTDIKATLLDMVEKNEINRALLTLLDENIANAYRGNQKEAGDYMEKDYIHRVGRSARAGRSGVGISLVDQYELEWFIQIEKLIGKKLPKYPAEEYEERVAEAKKLSKMNMEKSGGMKKRRGEDDEESERFLGGHKDKKSSKKFKR